MNLNENYLDTEIPKKQLKPNKNGDYEGVAIVAPTSEPTTSVNMDETFFTKAPLAVTLTGDHSMSRSVSLNSLSTAYRTSTRTPSQARKPLARSKLLSADLTGSNDSIAQPTATLKRHSDPYFNWENDIRSRLAESIYSMETSVRGSEIQRRPYVSNEIPNVFKLSKLSDSSKPKDSQASYDKNFLIFTSAGKPIYCMHGKDEQIMSYTGLINTIISYFQVNGPSELKTISTYASGKRLTFLDKSPILLMAQSERGESSNELLNQLDFLYSYILSSLSERQLLRLFSKRENFDLRNYLETTDFENLNEICSLICNRMFPDLLLNSLQCLPFRHSSRVKLQNVILQQLDKRQDIPRGTLLYGLIIAPQNKLCCVLRPKGHTLHTTDLHLLFCLISHQFQNLDETQELWVPICFPKFNSSGFLYCYIKFLPNSAHNNEKSALVLISAQKDAFFSLKSFSDELITKLEGERLLKKINSAKGFKLSDIPAPMVHHFIYKSKQNVQYVMPHFEVNSNITLDSSQRLEYELKLKTYYQQLHGTVVRDNGNLLSRSILNFVKWSSKDNEDQTIDDPRMNFSELDEYVIGNSSFEQESVNMLGIAWVTPKFELYLIGNNGVVDKKVLLRSARKVANWCQKNESRLFISDGAVF
ncbi:mon1p [Saccharomyces arboricola H-6]|uniref:Vacuolar fusion protein MON1 n=1 Tax=Saccharomyces arboricola (strain H-6 / AS 2.3317 / CBS 10644) TaxID=1160507 RepID=J8PNT3_SACAR|nr:mon1p [Saccharomyces arboricola H-6]